MVLYSFTPNTYYTNLLNVEPSNLKYLRTYDIKFDDIIITNGRRLQMENKLQRLDAAKNASKKRVK